MILKVHSDAAYLVAPGARSRVGGHFYLGDTETLDDTNVPLHAVANILKFVMASAAEADEEAYFTTQKKQSQSLQH